MRNELEPVAGTSGPPISRQCASLEIGAGGASVLRYTTRGAARPRGAVSARRTSRAGDGAARAAGGVDLERLFGSVSLLLAQERCCVSCAKLLGRCAVNPVPTEVNSAHMSEWAGR